MYKDGYDPIFEAKLKTLELLAAQPFKAWRFLYQVKHSKILHGTRLALSVLYGSQNGRRLLLDTSLSGWFL